MEKYIDITQEQKEIIQTLLQQYIPDTEVWAYGSRVTWRSKPTSDLDLVAFTSGKKQSSQIMALKDALEESSLPFRVDLFVWDEVPQEFQKNIKREHVVLLKKNNKCIVPNGWSEFLVDELKSSTHGSIAIGPFGSRLKSENYVNAGVKVVRGNNVTAGRNVSGDFVHITKEKAQELGTANLKAFDLVFPHRGAIGEVGIVPSDENNYVISSSLMKIECDTEKVNPYFLYYFFKSPAGKFELLKNASQVGTPGIGQPLNSLKNIKIQLPLITEQSKIVELLLALDERTQLLHETNTTLEDIAQTLFTSWFVNFDPVHAKKEGRMSEGMDAKTAALFPNSFEESELGLIPQGWKVQSIEKDFTLLMGQSPSGDTYNTVQEGVPFFQGCTDFGKVYPEKRMYCTSPIRIANKDDILLSIRAPVGPINKAWEKCCIGRGLAAIQHVSQNPAYTFSFLQSIQRKIAAYDDSGTVFGSITKKQLSSIKVISPPIKLISSFESIASLLADKIRINTEKISSYIQIRDSLLPRLISGQLRLPEFANATCKENI